MVINQNNESTSTQKKSNGRTKMLLVTALGALLLNPPLLEIFSSQRGASFLGWPLHVIYLYCVWTLLVVLAAWPRKKKEKTSFRQDMPVKGSTDEV